VSLLHDGNDMMPLAILPGVSVLCGGSVWIVLRKHRSELAVRDAYSIVDVRLDGRTGFGSLPFLLSGAIPSFTDAFF